MSKCCSIGIGVALAAAAFLGLPGSGYADCGEQLAELLADDGAKGDFLGSSVSTSGDVAVIGAWHFGFDTGSAYVFRRGGTEWLQEQKLLANDGAPEDQFGYSVSVSGDVALIGARRDDDNGSGSGSAYVFRWDGTEWLQEQKLLPDDGAPEDQFGYSVSVSGDVAVIGAIFDDDNGGGSGSAYVFRWDGVEWREEQKLLAHDGALGDRFGGSVCVTGDLAVIGARGWHHGTHSGSSYVFRRHGTEWLEEQKLLPGDGAPGDNFGMSVSISGDVVVVGARFDDDNGIDSGSAYVFRWGGTDWFQEQKLRAEDGAPDDRFGDSVSVSGELAVIGALYDDENGEFAGSAYVFRWNGTEWRQAQKLLPDDGHAGAFFGTSVSISGEAAVVGAPGANNGDRGRDSGVAYIFDLGGCDGCTRIPEWQCDGDVDGDGQVNPVDSGLVQAAFGSVDEQDVCNYDVDCDGQINPVDSGIVQSLFGTCEAPRDVCP